MSFFPHPLDLPAKPGFERVSRRDWDLMTDFITSRAWDGEDPVLPTDRLDPLLAPRPPYGAFMLGFDFHLTYEGPRLIEINTNAGGFATLIHLAEQTGERELYEEKFVAALKSEVATAGLSRPLVNAVIVDDDLPNQRMLPEMQFFASLLTRHGIKTEVIEARGLVVSPQGLVYQNQAVDFVYNRLTDFRLQDPAHAALRAAAIARTVVLTPHPAVYVRVADKRNLLRLKHPVIPECHLLSDRPLKDWELLRKHFVFKPPAGAATKGVYRGDKITLVKLASLPPDTIVQKIAEPSRAEDGSKMDIRIFTRGTEILGALSRQFTGQVMEMQSEKSGVRMVKVEE